GVPAARPGWLRGPRRAGRRRRVAARGSDHGHRGRLAGGWGGGRAPWAGAGARPRARARGRVRAPADRGPAGGALVAQADLALSGAGLWGPHLDRAGGWDRSAGGADPAGPGRGPPGGWG